MFKRIKEVEKQINEIHSLVNNPLPPNELMEFGDLLMKYKHVINKGDPDNKSGDKYINYVNGMDAAFETGLRDKIEYFISEFKNELAKFPLTEKEEIFYRAAINFGYLLLEYGDSIKAKKTAFLENNDTDVFNSDKEE